ncbi:hypothetical protein HanXRQr2_Chr02g0058971 [Helianthus annuus]|uniref:Uncharacterized protein n=1 Tax=Helianthus annuus TaxID=4232 RepID=A0A251VF05_HELAN|nr:hypothetical protein HanXRQr2_Chr02g0058971 [Helianthus annuus]
MGARICFVILFFWALLTIITPILVRLSTNPNPLECYDEDESDFLSGIGWSFWLKRRCECTSSVETVSTPAPEPASTISDLRTPHFYMMEINCKGLSRKFLVTSQMQ